MRKVTEQVTAAFLARQSRTVGNTSTDGASLFLHGNKIAEHIGPNLIRVTLAGWDTATTRNRLAALVSVHRSKGATMLQGKPMDPGQWYTVTL